MTTPSTTIAKIPLDAPVNKYIVLKTTWSADPIQLEIILLNSDCHLLSSADEYTGVLTMNQIESVANALDASVDEMLNETKAALGTDGGSPQFSYELESGRFQWHKNGILKMVYGTVELNPAYDIALELLLTSLQIKSEYKSSCDRLSGELTAAQRHHEQIKEVYDRSVADQVEKEEQTLTKYLALLNEKKKKIGQLENLLGQVQGDDDEPMDAFDNANSRDCNEGKEQAKKPSASEVDTTGSTRVLKKRNPRNRNQAEATHSKPSTSAAASVAKPPENNNNLSPESAFSKDTEPMFWEGRSHIRLNFFFFSPVCKILTLISDIDQGIDKRNKRKFH